MMTVEYGGMHIKLTYASIYLFVFFRLPVS